MTIDQSNGIVDTSYPTDEELWNRERYLEEQADRDYHDVEIERSN